MLYINAQKLNFIVDNVYLIYVFFTKNIQNNPTRIISIFIYKTLIISGWRFVIF